MSKLSKDIQRIISSYSAQEASEIIEKMYILGTCEISPDQLSKDGIEESLVLIVENKSDIMQLATELVSMTTKDIQIMREIDLSK